MKCILLTIIPFFLQTAEWDQLFSDNDDPSIFHHVNVVSGHLNLSFQDVIVQGAEPIPISRTYSSSGALERSFNNRDLILKALRNGWMIQGGWNFLPQTNLFIELNNEGRKYYTATLAEPNGHLISYIYSHKQPKSKIIFLKPDHEISQVCGHLSARTNPQNNLLRLDIEAGEAVLFLPNGGSRMYRGEGLQPNDEKTRFEKRFFYHLETEILPNNHRLNYSYDSKSNLTKIESSDPSGTKVYASINIDCIKEKHTPTVIRLNTSDGKQLDYQTVRQERREYLNELRCNCRPQEHALFAPGRKSIGSRMVSFDIEGQGQLNISYYCPSNLDQEREWAKKPQKKEPHIDKVSSIQEPVGSNGEMIATAIFTYYPQQTDVRDADGLLIRYHHDDERILCIEYFDSQDTLHSSQKFYWDGSLLHCKAMFDAQNHPLFAKTFAYDNGNVVEEILWGDLTGTSKTALQIDAQGNPAGAETYRRTYAYYETNLIQQECEEEGPTYEYFYKPDTDLLELKLTKDSNNRIWVREFYIYNDENLLIAEILDNGTSLSLNDTSHVTQRLKKTYQLNASGLPEMVTESFWDPDTQTENLLKRTQLSYIHQQVVEEAVFDAQDVKRYTIFTEYDSFGHVKRKTNPLCQENIYHYNHLGYLEEAQEVGSLKKTYRYDPAGRLISCKDPIHETLFAYDAKGRILWQTDSQGNAIQHSYDCFGNRLATRFPPVRDLGEPISTFEYDNQGNLIAAKMPQGETTHTSYNLLKKPILVIQPDGTQIQHIYHKNGTLAQTILPDGTEIHYSYDLFQRMITKTITSSAPTILSQESWDYDAFQLRSTTDTRGLTTRFFYDGAGRKIAETAEGRTTSYVYDALGFLEKTNDGMRTLIQKHNVAGLIEKQWEEDSTGRIENEMQFFYDADNHKEKAIRITSCGEAIDGFHYQNGKLDCHTDPNGAITQFITNENFKNEWGQTVLQKTSIDPLGNVTIETYDVGHHRVALEKEDPQGRTVFKESMLYDLSGNQSKRISSIYQDGQFIKDVIVAWETDAMGRITAEIEAGQKRTTFEYDLQGRIACKTLPSHLHLHNSYDGIGRQTELCSSDGTIHFQYIYGQGPEPIQISDLAQNLILKRSYNHFGQLAWEITANGFTFLWDYDLQGRCTAFTLPDQSSIHYSFRGDHMSAIQRLSSTGSVRYEHQYLAFDPNGHVSDEQLILNLGSIQSKRDLLERPSSQTSPWCEQSLSYGPSGLVMQTHNSLLGDKHCEYDALNQLIREENQRYAFDSLGNPMDCTINDLNQITATDHCELIYDADGNPKTRLLPDHSITYNYDALGRLTEIIDETSKIHYFYDPLSRCLAKEIDIRTKDSWQKQQKVFYLYNQDREIGTCDEQGHILEFKTVGLGLKGDIGGTIAIEINDSVYAPYHDFRGNIIALIDADGQIKESYNIDAFGQEQLGHKSPINPWRFCSKRNEEGLIFFGLRFYDPSLKRWLTPDPAGFGDGSNLYVYVLNSPFNRLDLFGLFSEDPFNLPNINIYMPAQQFLNMPNMGGVLCKGSINGATADFYIFCNHWHQLQFTPEELHAERLDIAKHFNELIPEQGKSIAMTSYGNGIDTMLRDFYFTNEEMSEKIGGAFMLSLYNPTEGKVMDMHRTKLERRGVDTPTICKNRQFIMWAATNLQKINPEALWLLIPHSEGGVIAKRSIEGLPEETQEILRHNLYVYAVGPADALPKSQGAEVLNVFSNKDYITGVGPLGYAKKYLDNPDYDIHMLNCASRRSDRILWIADHGFLKPTYKAAWMNKVDSLQLEVGFYGKNINDQTR